ncbi:MAG: HDOD domain-containing protein [Candidatus Acidiferrales bacterium]
MTTLALTDLRARVKSIDAVPTVPMIIRPLMAMLELPPDQVQVSKIVEMVSWDKTIAAQCLRMSNSALFGRAREIENVRDAVVALGLQRVQAILLSCCLNQVIPADEWIFDAVAFWRHSLGCALVSRKFGQLIGCADPEKVYLAGLLHDLGILVNSVLCPEEFRAALDLAKLKLIPLDQAEELILGFSHAEAGAILAEQWHLPPDLIAVIEFHHKVENAKDAKALVALVHLSDLLCRVRGLGYGYYEAICLDMVEESAWKNVAEEYPQLGRIDLARFTFEIDGAMPEIYSLVDSVFAPQL